VSYRVQLKSLKVAMPFSAKIDAWLRRRMAAWQAELRLPEQAGS